MRADAIRCVALMFVASSVATAQRDRTIVSAVSYTSTPARMKVDASVVRRLRVPDGFAISVFAQGLGNARMLAVAKDGTIYITRRDSGDVLAIRDEGNGKASAPFAVVRNLRGVHGIALHDGRMYLATVKEIFVADMNDNGTVDNLRAIVTDLPDGGQNPNRTLAFGPDSMLYVSVGSTCNLCIETNEESATMLRMKADGTERGVYARGLRNTIGWGWHPVTRELWGMDHGSDAMGDDRPPEELNKVQNVANYGWPFCYADQVPDSNFNYEPPGSTKKELCPRTTGSVLEYQAHSAPIQLAFYSAKQFPDDYRNDAFVAMRGSWNRQHPSGYKLVRIHFENGKPTRFEDFVTGFISADGDTHFGRLAGVAVAKDGSVLLGDDTNGMIYRIAYGTRAASAERTHVAAGEVVLDTTAVAMPPRNATPLPPKPAVRANRVAFVDGLRSPESVIYDADQDVYFVSNVDGKSAGKDGRGFITRIPAKDGDKTTRWIDSGDRKAMLNAPKGMAIVADTLWVADIDVMRSFNRKTGAPIAVVDFGTMGATFLNDVAVGGDGNVYVTDTEIKFDTTGNTSHPRRDRIFRLDRQRMPSLALETDRLHRPNGIVWDKTNGHFVIASLASDTIWTWRPNTDTVAVLTRGPGQFDGVAFTPSGTLLVSSKATSSIYALENGRLTPIVQHVPDVADFGIDPQRGLLLVPLTASNRMEMYRAPELKPPARDP